MLPTAHYGFIPFQAKFLKPLEKARQHPMLAETNCKASEGGFGLSFFLPSSASLYIIFKKRYSVLIFLLPAYFSQFYYAFI
jgi:hypothetical protein